MAFDPSLFVADVALSQVTDIVNDTTLKISEDAPDDYDGVRSCAAAMDSYARSPFPAALEAGSRNGLLSCYFCNVLIFPRLPSQDAESLSPRENLSP